MKTPFISCKKRSRFVIGLLGLSLAARLPLAAQPDQPPRSDEQVPEHKDVPRNSQTPTSTFVLRSSAVTNGGTLPVEFTGDGAAATLPLEWSGAPAGTKSYALIMHHEAPDMTKWYWILYNLPADVQSLPKNVRGVGTLGNNSVNNRTEYAPPHSKGPGPKIYIYTVYALIVPPKLFTGGEGSCCVLLRGQL